MIYCECNLNGGLCGGEKKNILQSLYSLTLGGKKKHNCTCGKNCGTDCKCGCRSGEKHNGGDYSYNKYLNGGCGCGAGKKQEGGDCGCGTKKIQSSSLSTKGTKIIKINIR